MSDLVAAANDALAREAPSLFTALGPLGRRVAFPPDIPFQAAQARGKTYNATIGQITDGAGKAVPLGAIAAGLSGLDATDRNRALLYAPVEGIAELRERWRDWQRRGVTGDVPSTLPIAVDGLTHGLAIVADLFGAEGRALAVPRPFWGNYRQTFATRAGCRVVVAPAYRGGAFNPLAWEEALADEPAGEPSIALVNVPSNPGGYSPTGDEREALLTSLRRIAAVRPLVVVCDDAYAGLVYEDDVPVSSLFWDLAALVGGAAASDGDVPADPAARNLVPVKIDGATKELLYFGGRVGFVTFAVPPGEAAAQALESKVKCLTRAVVGSPVATSQVLMLQALRDPAQTAAEFESARQLLAGRYRALRDALATTDRALLRPLPFNAGCFALVELPEELGLVSEDVRQHLLAHEDTGLVSIAPRYLRIAFCSIAEAAIPELVRRVERAVRQLAERG